MTSTDLTREDPAVLRDYYRQMALIRAFELRAAEMYTRARSADTATSTSARKPPWSA